MHPYLILMTNSWVSIPVPWMVTTVYLVYIWHIYHIYNNIIIIHNDVFPPTPKKQQHPPKLNVASEKNAGWKAIQPFLLFESLTFSGAFAVKTFGAGYQPQGAVDFNVSTLVVSPRSPRRDRHHPTLVIRLHPLEAKAASSRSHAFRRRGRRQSRLPSRPGCRAVSAGPVVFLQRVRRSTNTETQIIGEHEGKKIGMVFKGIVALMGNPEKLWVFYRL